MIKNIFFAAISLFVFSGMIAQMPAEALRNQFINDWERAKAYTIDYLNTVPAGKYGFKATDSIRSFAQQMLHLAQSNVNIIVVVAGEPSIIGERNLQDSESAQSKDSVMYYVVSSYDLVISGLKKMNMALLEEKVKFAFWTETKYAWLLKAFEHQTHHRGQTTIYIRLLGLNPPQERLF